MDQRLTAILPCNDFEQAQAFFERLGFSREAGPDDYRMLSDGLGGYIHLTPAVEGWLTPGRNPFGLYLYRKMSMASRPPPKARPWKRMGQATSRGECTSSPSTDPTTPL
jgi:hypothetical protein